MLKQLLENKDTIRFYDVEVFAENSMVVFKDWEGNTVKVFSSSLDGLGKLWEQGLITEEGFEHLESYIKDKTLIGYNNYFYDDYILYAMSMNLGQKIIKTWNDSIILKRSTINMKKITICPTLDAWQQIDVSRPGLKKIEANMGVSIVESTVDFDIDRPLTPAENYEVFEYCEYDVSQTAKIFKMRKQYYKTKNDILTMLPSDLQRKAYKWNTTTIVSNILAPKRRVRGGLMISEEMLDLVPLDVQNMWRELATTQDYKFKKKKVTVQEAGCNIDFGWGGLHGAPLGTYEAKNVKLYDAASLYPNILIILNGLAEKTADYKAMLDERLALKAAGKKAEQEPLKLILNSSYGLLNNKYSLLFNPSLAFSICIYGQISLYVLSKMLHNVGCKVFNINTDGVAFVPDKGKKYKTIIDEWESQFSLNLEEDTFKYWRQKDVNNYVALTDSDYIVTKGGDVNKYHDGGSHIFRNSNTRIIDKALVNKIVYNKSIPETVWEHRNDVELFQYILQAGHTYQGTYDTNDQKLQNVNRVFAGKGEPYELYKKRHDGGLVKFPDTPDSMIVWNGDLSEFDETDNLDLNFYNKLAEKKYESWRV